MARPGAALAALKASPGGARRTPAPQSSGMGRISPVQAEMYYNNPYQNTYGPFLQRPSRVFTDGAFAPMSPIQPTPLDQPPPGGIYPGPRYWQYRTAWNLPTPPGTEGLKLASFDQLRTLAQKYSVARACIELRQEEIRGLDWSIALTSDAAKAYQKDRAAMRDFGERKAKFTRFFKRPDPDFWNFDSFLNALLEEIFVYDALSLVFRPKFGASFGMGGRGLLGSDLDSLRLISGPTIRPLLDLQGGKPAPPNPAYQQFLYGVPRSDYMTIMTETDIDEAGLLGAEVNNFNADVMLYAPFWSTRETPYGFPPVERALLPIISGLQKQEFQLDYFTEGTVPAVYISPGDNNITPTQIGELQNALNALAGDPAYHLKVVVLPPGSKVEPQRPVDLSDSFDYLVMNQVCMAFDIQPQELGIIPDIGATPTGPSASGVRFAGQTARDIKSRKSTKPLLKFICGIFNRVIQDICGQYDIKFEFEGLVDDEDKQAITQLGVEQVQNGISSIDEVRERLDLPPWGLQETSEPVVFTAQGPVPFSMAPQLIMAAMQGAGGGSDSSGGQKTSSTRSRTKQPTVRQGGQTKPNGSHPAPVAPQRPTTATPQHAAAQGAIQTPTPSTGGTTGRSSVAGSRKKAATAELDALRRHLRKGREISSWEPVHITDNTLARIAEDVAKGVLLDTAIERAGSMTETLFFSEGTCGTEDWTYPENIPPVDKTEQWPGWESDLGLVGRYKQEISQAFQDAEIKGAQIRKDAATGKMFVSAGTLHGLISDVTSEVFLAALTPLWEKAWKLGYDSAGKLTGKIGDYGDHLRNFLDTEGQHWLQQIARTGLGNSDARSEIIARTEVARAVNDGALQCYRDNGITRKQLLIAPDDACDECWAAKDEGEIPLDSIFPGGEPPYHPNCRCVSGPAGVDIIPPLSHIGKSLDHEYVRDMHSGAGNCTCGMDQESHPEGSSAEDDSRVAWLLIRARDEDGKWRYLLQQRNDGSWGMPGGTCHLGESGYTAAYREVTEEVGDLPQLTVIQDFSHVDPDGTISYLYLCECTYFHPELNGATPEETRGTGWFRKKEIGNLNLTGKFRDDWDREIHLADNLPKSLQNTSNEMGEWLVADDPDRHGAGLGSRWPYPSRAGREWPDAGPGAVPGPSAGGEPPHEGPQDLMDTEEARIYPRGHEDEYPRKRPGTGTPASRFPDQGDEDQDKWPEGGIGSSPGIGALSVGKALGKPVGYSPPGGTGQSLSGGPVAAVTPHPYEPHAIPPIVMAPDGNEEEVGEPGDSPVHHILPTRKGTGGASDYSDPNPVDAEHVYLQMARNFPPEAIAWVKRARWIGPVNVPWDRVDTDDKDKWAASHQPQKVNEFVRQIRAHNGHVAPSIIVQEPNSNRGFLVDGHHRALAREKLKQPVLAYVGNIDAKDRPAAWETHTKQLHQGNDPANKAQ